MLDFNDPLFVWSLLTLTAIVLFILFGGIWMSLHSRFATGPKAVQTDQLSANTDPGIAFALPAEEAAAVSTSEQPLYLKRTATVRRILH